MATNPSNLTTLDLDTSLSEVFDLLAEEESFILKHDEKNSLVLHRSEVTFYRFLSQEG